MDAAAMRWLAYLLAWVAALPIAAGASAHTFDHPKHEHVRLTGDAITVDMEYTIPPGDLARRTRELFDSDGNGTLGDRERESLEAYLRTSALHFLKIELNGKPLELSEASAEIRGAELQTSSALELTAIWKLEAPKVAYKSKNVLVLRDRHKDGALQVPILVTVNGETHEYLLDVRHPQIRLRFKRPENRMNP